MRISTREKDYYYSPFAIMIKEIRCNGELVLMGISLDTTDGWIEVLEIPTRTLPNGELATYIKKGKITLVLGDKLEIRGGKLVLARQS